MNGFISFVQTASFFLFILLLGLVIILFLLLSQTNRRLNRLRKRYDMLLRGRGEIDMETLVATHSREIDEQTNRLIKLQEDDQKRERSLINRMESLEEQSSDSINKIGFHKYNAFEYMTNELSFSVALLDSKGNGLILTSIYGRETSNTYAKEILKGKPVDQLSIEEEIALGRAIN